MDTRQKMSISLCLIGVIIFSISIGYFPQSDSVIPDGMTSAEYTRLYNEKIINSTAFKSMIGGLVITGVSLVYLIARYYYYEEPINCIDTTTTSTSTNTSIKSILKEPNPSQIAPVPSENTIITLKSQVPIKKVKFKYPPPYDKL
jgi:hypothetical protein